MQDTIAKTETCIIVPKVHLEAVPAVHPDQVVLIVQWVNLLHTKQAQVAMEAALWVNMVIKSEPHQKATDVKVVAIMVVQKICTIKIARDSQHVKIVMLLLVQHVTQVMAHAQIVLRIMPEAVILPEV